MILSIIFISVPKTKEPSLGNTREVQSSNGNQSFYVAGGFLLVMFGAIVVRPLFRLLFKMAHGEKQSTFNVWK